MKDLAYKTKIPLEQKKGDFLGWRRILLYGRIFVQVKKMGVMRRTSYPINFFILLGAAFVQISLNLIFVKVIFGFVDNVAGWEYYPALLVVGTFLIIEGLLWTLFGNLSEIPNFVKSGSLDFVLVKPIDAQFLVSVWRGDIEDLTRIITGGGVLFYALFHLGLSGQEAILNLFLYGGVLLNALVIAYSFDLIIKSLIFWVTEGKSLFRISGSLLRLSQYPSDIFYQKLIRLFVSSIVPLFFIATVPAKILADGFDKYWLAGSLGMAVLFFSLARWFWLWALRHYSSASS